MRKITIGMLLYPGFQMLDIAGPGDAFAEVDILSGGNVKYELVSVGTTRKPVPTASGFTITPDRTIFDPCPHFDTLIVPGGLGVFNLLEDTTVIDWIMEQIGDCRRVGAICNGVFALGATGLLNGKTVTTHWMDAANLASMFRRVNVNPDRIYIKEGSIYTTAGVTAGIDLALALIEEDCGKKIALDVAKYLVVYLRRSSGQSQFSPLLETQAAQDSVIGAAQSYITEHLDIDHTLASLAEHMQMSKRNLSRVFKKECGMTAMNFVTDARIDAARRCLESTELGLKDVAQRCGFEYENGMRRIFVRRLNISPADYRQRFRL
jgi:transcriptional regulator GlxA family with amidase domain